MLDVVNLTKHYKQQKAVQGVNLHLDRGEIVGLLGPNGAGKSTAIAMISSLIHPTDGKVRFEGEDAVKHPRNLRKKLGVVPQEIALYEDLTAKENLFFFGRIQQLRGNVLEERVESVLEQIGLSDQGKKLVKNFSGGMKRRLNIGAALLHEPEILIMDEPTVGIDPQSRNYILEAVKRLNQEKGMTILYTSHYMEEVEFLCDRIYIMDRGNVIASGTKEEIKNILSSEKTIVVKTDRRNEEFINQLKQLPVFSKFNDYDQIVTLTVPKEEQLFSRLFKLAEETGANVNSIDVQTPTLEDVFLHLTGRALRN